MGPGGWCGSRWTFCWNRLRRTSPWARFAAQLEAIPGIESVHDLHVWAVTPAVVAMSAHCIVREPKQHQHVLEHIHDAMRLFGIEHVTIQLERDEMLDREEHLHA